MKNILILLCVLSSYVYAQPESDKGRIYVTVDQGVNWARADVGLPVDAVVNALASMGEIVIVGTERHGIFISSDRMKSWYSSSKGLPQTVRILSIVQVGKSLLVGTYLHGLFYSDDLGNHWHPASRGLTNSNIRVLYNMEGIVYAGTDGGLFISSDGGLSWKIFLSGLQINSMTSAKKELFVATNKGVLRTNNFGSNWNWIYKHGAISSITSNSTDLYMLDFAGTAYKAMAENYVWIKADLFLPFHCTFQLTPGGRQFFTTDWNKTLRGIVTTNKMLWANGIPLDVPIKELLVTPFGVLAIVGSMGGC